MFGIIFRLVCRCVGLCLLNHITFAPVIQVMCFPCFACRCVRPMEICEHSYVQTAVLSDIPSDGFVFNSETFQVRNCFGRCCCFCLTTLAKSLFSVLPCVMCCPLAFLGHVVCTQHIGCTPIAADEIAQSCVCLLVTCKTDQMHFGWMTQMGPRNQVLDGVKIPHPTRRVILGVVQPIEMHCKTTLCRFR